MPIALTCDCGARFEVADLFAGQEVGCPECQQQIKAPARVNPNQRTSLLALLSLVLAIAGGFTLVGSVFAVVFGLIALMQIQSRSELLTGRTYALTGVLLGVAGFVGTFFLIRNPDRVPAASWVRRWQLVGQIDSVAMWPAGSRDNVCLIPKPAVGDWIRLRGNRGEDPGAYELQVGRDVLLYSPTRRAYIDVAMKSFVTAPVRERDRRFDWRGKDKREKVKEKDDLPEKPREMPSLQDYRWVLEDELLARQADEDEFDFNRRREQDRSVDWGEPSTPLDIKKIENFEGVEWPVTFKRGGMTWRLLVRVYREKHKGKPAGKIYIVRYYAPQRKFAATEQEAKNIITSIRWVPAEK